MKLLDELRRRYPHNPLFLQAVAEVQDVYLHDHPASLATWRAMFDLARQRRLALPEMSEARARVGIADELDALIETDYAMEQLRVVEEARPAAPYGAPRARWLRLGAAQRPHGRARRGGARRTEAAIAAAPRRRPRERPRPGARGGCGDGPTRAWPRRTASRSRAGGSCSAARLARAADVARTLRVAELLRPRHALPHGQAAPRARAAGGARGVRAGCRHAPAAPPFVLAAVVPRGRAAGRSGATAPRAIELYRRAAARAGRGPRDAARRARSRSRAWDGKTARPRGTGN